MTIKSSLVSSLAAKIRGDAREAARELLSRFEALEAGGAGGTALATPSTNMARDGSADTAVHDLAAHSVVASALSQAVTMVASTSITSALFQGAAAVDAVINAVTGQSVKAKINNVVAGAFSIADPFGITLTGATLDLTQGPNGLTYLQLGAIVVAKVTSTFDLKDTLGITQLHVGTGALIVGNSLADVMTIQSQLNIPVAAAGSVVNPPAGTYALFFNSSNADKLTKKKSDGTLTVIGAET